MILREQGFSDRSLSRHLEATFSSFLLLALFIISVHAQSSTGYILGRVHDNDGASIPKAEIILSNQQSGIKRTTQSDQEGKFNFPAVTPGTYSLRTVATGFSSVELTGITISISSVLNYEVLLKIGATNEELTISAISQMVDTTSPEVGGVVSQSQIATLPINSRQYLSLALLLPGTSLDSTRSFFPTVNVGGSMTFNSTANIADGVSNNWAEDGEPRQNLPEDSVQEFKVSNAQFRAEFGLATGGAVQVITKSGTNQLHGTGFEYFRDKLLNARNIFEKDRPNFRRHQFGGSLGGPVLKDRMHFFFAGERTQQDDFYTVNTGLPQFYSSLEGTFLRPSHRNLYLGRVDWQVRNSQNIFFRYAQEDEHTECSGCGGTTDSSAGFDQDTPRRSFVAGHTWTIGSNRLNEFRFQHARGGYYIAPHGTKIWKEFGKFPAERINRLSRSYIFPSLTYGSSFDDLGPESRWQIRDTYGIFLSQHNVKIGVDYSYLPYSEERTGNILGTYTFAQDQFFNPNDTTSLANLRGAVTFSASIPPISTAKPTHYGALFIQDDWKLNNHLTLNLGLRYERFYGSSNEDLDPTTFPIKIPFIDVSRRGDNLNFGPRIGLAWNVREKSNIVLRAGYGIYYGHVRVGANLSEYRNYKQFSVNITNPPYPDPYLGQDPTNFIVSGPANITILANDFRQPYAEVFSLGGSWQLLSQLALHVDGIYNLTLGDRKIQDINPRNTLGVRPLSQFGRIDQHESTANLKYRALYIKLEKQLSLRNQFLISYTYNKSEDSNPLVRYIDPFNKALDWGPSNGERRHALVASGTILIPWNVTLGGIWTLRSQLPWTPIAGRDLNRDGFNTDLIPGINRNSGGRGLNLNAINEWRRTNGLLPLDPSVIDSSRINVVDARISKAFHLKESLKLEFLIQAFNLFNTRNLQSQYGGGRIVNSLSTQFGRIATARPSRQAELALRVSW